MFIVEAGAENPLAAGCVSVAISMLYRESADAEYRKTKSEMQDWLVAQKIVQEILKEDEQKKEQLHEQEVRQEEENRQSSR